MWELPIANNHKKATKKCEVIVVFHLIFKLLCKQYVNGLKILYKRFVGRRYSNVEDIARIYLLKIWISYSSGPSCHSLHQFCSLRQAYFCLNLLEGMSAQQEKKKGKEKKEKQKQKQKKKAVTYRPHCLLRRIDTNNWRFHCFLGMQWVKWCKLSKSRGGIAVENKDLEIWSESQ